MARQLVFLKDSSENSKNYFVKDFETNSIKVMRRKEIMEDIKNFQNVMIIDGKLSGKHWNIERLGDYIQENPRVYIHKVLKDSNGDQILGYFYLNKNGKENFVSVDDIYKMRKTGFSNATITGDTIDIKNMNDLDVELKVKQVNMGSDEYYDLYKKYNLINLIALSNVKTSRPEKFVFGRVICNNYVPSGFEGFITGHKLIHSMLSKSTITKVVKLPYKISFREGKAVEHSKEMVCKVDFKFRNLVTAQVLVLSNDKKLLTVLVANKDKVVATSKKEYLDLLENPYQEEIESFETLNTILQSSDKQYKEMITNIKDALKQKDCDIEIKNGKLIVNNKEAAIRRNILIGSDDYACLEANVRQSM